MKQEYNSNKKKYNSCNYIPFFYIWAILSQASHPPLSKNRGNLKGF